MASNERAALGRGFGRRREKEKKTKRHLEETSRYSFSGAVNRIFINVISDGPSSLSLSLSLSSLLFVIFFLLFFILLRLVRLAWPGTRAESKAMSHVVNSAVSYDRCSVRSRRVPTRLFPSLRLLFYISLSLSLSLSRCLSFPFSVR